MSRSPQSFCIDSVLCFCCGEVGNIRVAVRSMDVMMCKDCILVTEVGASVHGDTQGSQRYRLMCQVGEESFTLVEKVVGPVAMAAAATDIIEYFEDLKEFVLESTQFKSV